MPAVAENRAILKTSDGAQLIVAEKTTLLITATLLDEVGDPVQAAMLSTLTLTLYNRDSVAKEIINSLSAVNILNTGRGTVHATSGLLSITLQPDDNAMVDTATDLEWHRALIQGTYAGGTKAFKYEIDVQVRNLEKVS
jgi:hypothetical protein